jgi:hypothetical protein
MLISTRLTLLAVCAVFALLICPASQTPIPAHDSWPIEDACGTRAIYDDPNPLGCGRQRDDGLESGEVLAPPRGE